MYLWLYRKRKKNQKPFAVAYFVSLGEYEWVILEVNSHGKDEMLEKCFQKGNKNIPNSMGRILARKDYPKGD